ncbi:MAG: MarR family transcriptional regulator [Pseudomonadota bacterium]
MTSSETAPSISAGFALGRLAAAVERSPIRALWLNHETAQVVATLYSRGVEPMRAESLLALSAGLTDSNPSINTAAARRFWGQALRLWRTRVTTTPAASIPDITNALRAMSEGDMPAGDLALEAPLRMGLVTGWALPSVALALPPEDSGPRWSEAFFRLVTERCIEGLARLEQLERDYARWLQALPASRSDSRLRETVVLLGTIHALTPRYLVDALGLTRQAAARLLRQLEDLGIVRQRASRQRWLIYLAENAQPFESVPENTIILPTDEKALDEIDRVLDAAYRVLDRSMRRDSEVVLVEEIAQSGE